MRDVVANLSHSVYEARQAIQRSIDLTGHYLDIVGLSCQGYRPQQKVAANAR